jgi:hypothetical protein
MGAAHTNALGAAIGEVDVDIAVDRQWSVILADLVAFG